MKEVDYHAALPEVLTPNDIEASRRILRRRSLGQLYQWMQDKTETFETPGGQQFRAIVDRGEDSGKAVATFAEVGTPFVPRFVVKSQITRAFVDSAESASLVAILNGKRGDEWLNYSQGERAALIKGDMAPMVGRVAQIADAIGQPSEVTLIGTSQGAVGALAYGADSSTPAAGVAAIEPPNVAQRSLLGLARDFAGQHNDLIGAVAANFSDDMTASSDLAQHIQNESHLSLKDLPDVWHRMTLPDTVAAIRGMTRATAAHDIEMSLEKGGAVVHAWGTLDAVSPVKDNRAIADRWRGNPRYNNYELPLSHAALTDVYVVYAALARQARALRKS